MDEGDEFPPPPPHLPPEPPETPLDVQTRSMAEAIERVATLIELQMASGGRPPARETQSAVEIVRAPTDSCVTKSLNH